MEAIEKTRHKILTKVLKDNVPPKTRAALSWKQRDKVSSAWVLSIPGPDTTLSNAEFSEAAASNLCLPSPACAGRIGETVKGRVTLDIYGDNLQSTPLAGDHWRRRHNEVLHLTHRLSRKSSKFDFCGGRGPKEPDLLSEVRQKCSFFYILFSKSQINYKKVQF